MRKKAFRQLHDGLGTVAVEIELPQKRLQAIEDMASSQRKSVDSVIVEAITGLLVGVQEGHTATYEELEERVAELEAELTAQAETPRRGKRRKPGRRLRRSESSELQLYLFEV